MQGDTLFIDSGEDSGTVQGYKAKDNPEIDTLATDARKLIEKIFGEEIKKDFGDNVEYEW